MLKTIITVKQSLLVFKNSEKVIYSFLVFFISYAGVCFFLPAEKFMFNFFLLFIIYLHKNPMFFKKEKNYEKIFFSIVDELQAISVLTINNVNIMVNQMKELTKFSK